MLASKPTTTHNLMFGCVLAVLSSLATALPNPAVNRIDAIGFHSVSVDTADKPRCSILDGSTPILEAAVQLEARLPAVNRIDAVGQVVKEQSILSLAGGTPVTLDADEAKNLNASATEPPTIAASIPLISANPTANAGIPAAYFGSASSSATASHKGVRFEVPDTRTTLYLYYHQKQVFPQLDLGQILAEAMVELRQTIARIGRDGPIPYDDWSFLRQKWDCIVLCESNPAPRSGGRQQHLTYGILHSTMAGLWGALYSKGNYFGADFEIWDGAWGWVGSGNIVPWQKGLQIGEGGNVTTS